MRDLDHLQVEPPKQDGNDKPIPPANLRLERTIEVIDTKKINVLYVEGQPRYEFRYIKFLMEQEGSDEKKEQVDRADGAAAWTRTTNGAAKDQKDGVDKTAISVFPAERWRDLNQYDVLIMGDCDPTHKKLQNSLNMTLPSGFVLGEDVEQGAEVGQARRRHPVHGGFVP